MLMRHYEVF